MHYISLRRASRRYNSPQLSPYSIHFIFMVSILAMIPSVSCSAGDDFSNNLFTDLSPLLALFGEQVTKQFLSDAMGWADYILFAMVPLGIVTAMVSAIRCGGPRWLKAIIGRAKESRATVELELMSSTSADVCELWNGHNIVRVIGNPLIMEVFYSRDWERNHHRGVYLPEELVSSTSRDGGYLYPLEDVYHEDQEGIPMHRFGGGDESRHLLSQDKLPPNISLNAYDNGISRWEMWIWASFGVVLQLGLLVFAGFSSCYDGLGDTFHLGNDKKQPVSVWAVTLVCVGTSVLVVGMILCCYLIDKSSKESNFRVNANLVWLQKGAAVGDQNFASYAIFAKGGHTRREFVKSHRDINIDNPKPIFRNLVVLATFLTFSGFIIQFVGMRNLHWSFPVTQLGCTILMAAVRAWVRRSLFSEPEAIETEPGHELDFLARNIDGKCGPLSVDLASIKRGIRVDESQGIVSRAFRIRQQLGILSPWGGCVGDIGSSLCKAIEGILKAIHESEYIDLMDTPNPDVFTWNVGIRAGGQRGFAALQVQGKSSKVDNSTALVNWTVDQKSMEALLSLLLENKRIESKTQSTRRVTHRKSLLGGHGPWERQISKWWTDNQDLPVNGWPRTRSGASEPDGSFWLPIAGFGSSFTREIFEIFFSEVTKKLIGGIKAPVKLRLAEKSGLHAFGFECDALESLVKIVSASGLSTHKEAFICIVDLLAFHGKLPQPKTAIPSIYERLQDPTLPKPVDIVEFIFHVIKAQVTLYLRRKRPDWESATRFLIEQLQVPRVDPQKIIHTHLTSMLIRLFRQASVLGESPGMSKLWKEACAKISPTTPNSSDSPPYPLPAHDEDNMLRKCLQVTSGYRPKIIPRLLVKAVDAGYDSVADLVLTLGTSSTFTTTELQALENSFNRVAKSPKDVLIDVFATHLYTFAATGVLRLKEINAEQHVRTLYFEGFDSVKKLLVSSDISFNNNLQKAAASGYLNVVELLLKNGADINAQSKRDSGQIPYVTINGGNRGTTRKILPIDIHRRTALQSAARGGHSNVFQVLLDREADVNTKSACDGGRTALQAAAEGGHSDLVQVLLDRGADVNAEAAYDGGRTALQAAAEGGHSDLVQVLLDRGADVNAEPARYRGRTVLQAAAEGGHSDVVQVLLDRGADVNAEPTQFGLTALQAAISGNHQDLVQMLRLAGAR